MVRKTILILALTPLFFSLNADSKRNLSGRIADSSYDTRDLVIRKFIGKSPREIFTAFRSVHGLTYSSKLHTPDRGMFDPWKHSVSTEIRNGVRVPKEDLLVWELWLKEKKWKIKGRPVIYFKAKFSKPVNKNNPYVCWDAFYLLGSKNTKPQCLCPAPLGMLCPVHKR